MLCVHAQIRFNTSFVWVPAVVYMFGCKAEGDPIGKVVTYKLYNGCQSRLSVTDVFTYPACHRQLTFSFKS